MKKAVVIIVLLMLMAGCTSYYKVTDLNSGKDYYTNDIKYKGSGAVDFKDAKTGSRVVLPSSEIHEIEKEEFNHGKYSD
ncbi:MAG: hypothetical protein ACYSSP_12130 [Planctomycetota bacterium]|jgi:uncharacterized protein YceK